MSSTRPMVASAAERTGSGTLEVAENARERRPAHAGLPDIDELAEVLAHRRGGCGLAEGVQSPGVLNRSQQAVMRLVERRTQSRHTVGRDDQGRDLATGGVAAATCARGTLVPGDEQNPAVLERRGGEDARNDVRQPRVAGGDRAIVHVVAHV